MDIVLRLRISLLAIAATTALLGETAGPAWGAFPGRNGLLAVQGISGHGVVLVQPSGAVVRSICGLTVLCGNAQEARWSPDGRYLAFIDAASFNVEVISADETCMWCLLGRPLTSLRGSRPVFAPDEQGVTFAGGVVGTGAGLWRAGLTTGSTTRVVSGPISAAGWASTGELAIVRRGAVWVRPPRRGRFLRLASGGAPSWSPDGSKLAISRGGWISVVELKNRRVRRLAPGIIPAWSPDGRQIAYVGPGDVLRIMSANGRRSRSLGIPARSVDWQPLPRRRPRSCSPPRGSHVIASSPQAVVIYSTGPGHGASFGGWYGCLRGLGHWRPLQGDSAENAGYFTDISAIRLAGRFALLWTSYSDKYQGCSQSLALYDLASGGSSPVFDAACSFSPFNPNTAVLNSPVLDSSGFTAWRKAEASPRYESLNSVSCPSPSLCVAVDQVGNVAFSTDPTGGRPAWKLANVAGTTALSSVSCLTTNFCVAATNWGGNVLTSTNPVSGPSAWTMTAADPAQNGPFLGNYVSCPSTSLCVLAEGSGNIATSTDPAAGPSTWTSSHVLSGTPPGFAAISCPSTTLCVALDDHGDVVTTTNPTGGSSAWTVSHVDDSTANFPAPSGVSCPSTSLCVAVDGTANVLASSNPTGGAGAWTVTRTGSAGLSAASCPSTTLCVATDTHGNVLTSTNPTGGSGAWQLTNIDGSNALLGISCPSETRCIAVDAKGSVLSSDNPTGGSAAWTNAPVDIPDCAVQGTACVAEQLYARDVHGTRVLDSTPPSNGSSLGNISLAGNSLVLTWTHDGFARQVTLG